MKTLFLTSQVGGYKKTIKGNEVVIETIKCDNSNHFIDRLKAATPKINTMVFVASDPDNSKKCDMYAYSLFNSLNLDDFNIKNIIIIDHRFNGNIEETILSADAVFLSGGNVPLQNKYFKEIKLKEILNKYDGVIVGQSAGSMNCSKVVYTQPEDSEEFDDVNYQRKISGLGLVNFAVMPHMNSANEVDEQGHPTVMQMCLEDSYSIPHYGIVDYGFIEVKNNKAISYGETLLLKNGKCIKLCNNGEQIVLDNKQLTQNEYIK